MTFNNNFGTPRPMVQGNWTCAQCSKEITELPFEPRDNSNVLCSDCHRAKRQSFGGGSGGSNNRRGGFGGGFGGGNRGGSFQRKMYQGDWKCSDCGTAITELPFQPKDESNLKCRDCFKKDRV